MNKQRDSRILLGKHEGIVDKMIKKDKGKMTDADTRSNCKHTFLGLQILELQIPFLSIFAGELIKKSSLPTSIKSRSKVVARLCSTDPFSAMIGVWLGCQPLSSGHRKEASPKMNYKQNHYHSKQVFPNETWLHYHVLQSECKRQIPLKYRLNEQTGI